MIEGMVDDTSIDRLDLTLAQEAAKEQLTQGLYCLPVACSRDEQCDLKR